MFCNKVRNLDKTVLQLYFNATNCSNDLDKLNLSWWFYFRLKQFYLIKQLCHISATHFKSGQKRPKNNHLTAFTEVEFKSRIRSIVK